VSASWESPVSLKLMDNPAVVTDPDIQAIRGKWSYFVSEMVKNRLKDTDIVLVAVSGE
jgi:hypothetical protein